MHPKEAEMMFNQDLQKALKATVFPDDLLPENIDQIKHKTLQHESPISVGMSFPEYKVFVMKQKDYTLFEAAQLFNFIERRTPHELGIPDFYAVQEAVWKAGNEWQNLVTPIRDTINRKIEIMANNVGGSRESKLKRIIN